MTPCPIPRDLGCRSVKFMSLYVSYAVMRRVCATVYTCIPQHPQPLARNLAESIVPALSREGMRIRKSESHSESCYPQNAKLRVEVSGLEFRI